MSFTVDSVFTSLIAVLCFLRINAYCPIVCTGTDVCCGPTFTGNNYTCCDVSAKCQLQSDGVSFACGCVSPLSVACGRYCVPDGSCCNMPDYGGYCSGAYPYCCHNDHCCEYGTDVCCGPMTGTGCCPQGTVCCPQGGCCPQSSPYCACGRCWRAPQNCTESVPNFIYGMFSTSKLSIPQLERRGTKSRNSN